MSVNMRALSPDAYAALENFCGGTTEWPEIYGYMEPETVAWLAIRLEFVADSEETFPRGKWATIQRLQALLRGHAASLLSPAPADTPKGTT